MKFSNPFVERDSKNFVCKPIKHPGKTYCNCGAELGEIEIQQDRCFECEKTERKNREV
jgi:hypothetical protein